MGLTGQAATRQVDRRIIDEEVLRRVPGNDSDVKHVMQGITR